MKYFKSKYKYHTKLSSLPIVQWGLLNESIEKGKPRFEYLLILDRSLSLPRVSIKLKHKLSRVFEQLVYQIKNIDLTLRAYFHEFMYESNRLLHDLNQNLLYELKNSKKSTHINYDKCNDSFTKYLKYLAKNYKSFTFYKYQLRKDFINHYKKLKEVKPSELILKLFNEAPAFLTYYQYFEKVTEISKGNIFYDFVNNKEFINEFYKIEPHEIKDIFWYDNLIKKQFMNYNNYDSYIMERIEIFNIDNIQVEPIEKYNFYKELTNYISYKNMNIDEFTTSVEKYSTLIELAHQENNTKNNKPKPDKIKQFSEHG